MKEKSILVSDAGERFIWIEGGINGKMAQDFIRLMKRFKEDPSTRSSPLFIYIKGTGGEFEATVRMARQIDEYPNPVCTVAHGFVISGCFMLTQAGNHRLAMAGTKFRFHPAALKFKDGLGFIEQHELLHLLSQVKVYNAVQLSWFLRRGRPAGEICHLFEDMAVLSLPKAIKLGLVDNYFKEEDFRRDRRIARRLIREKYGL